MSWANSGLNNFGNLSFGYDDYTVGLFEKETGQNIPLKESGKARVRERYEWLVANAKEDWVAWRCDKIAELYSKIAARVQKARPDLLVLTNYFLNEPQGVDPRECGIDPTKLWNIPGVSLVSTVGYGRRLDDEIAVQRARDLNSGTCRTEAPDRLGRTLRLSRLFPIFRGHRRSCHPRGSWLSARREAPLDERSGQSRWATRQREVGAAACRDQLLFPVGRWQRIHRRPARAARVPARIPRSSGAPFQASPERLSTPSRSGAAKSRNTKASLTAFISMPSIASVTR